MTKTLKPGTKFFRTLTIERAIDAEARTLELSFSSETPYERWWGIEILDHGKRSVRLSRLKSGGPLLVDHDARDIVGVIESVRVDDDRIGRAVVRFGKSARAEEVLQDVQDGIRRCVSVGYVVHKAETVEGSDPAQPTYRITDWEPLEVSLVAVPADATVGVGRSLADGGENPFIDIPTQEVRTMTAETITRQDVEQAASRAREEALQAEQTRVNEILTIGQEYGAGELAAGAVRSGTDVTAFQRQVLEARKTGKIVFGAGARTEENLEKDPKLGFRNMGHFTRDVVAACRKSNPRISPELTRAATVYANEEAGPDGGYAIPPEFAQAISSLSLGEEALLPKTAGLPVEGNSMTYPDSEETPWGSDGVLASWDGEGTPATQSKPTLKKKRLELSKLRVLVAATDELLEDATAMSTYITRAMGEKVDWKVQDAIVNGTGVGMPKGITTSSAIVIQTKETGQAADTIVADNVAKIYSRALVGAGANLAWLINPDAFPKIITLSLNGHPIWVPNNGGFKDAPNGLLLGRPIILTDTCATLGDKFDIIYANLAGYRTITKSGGAQFSTSMHLWFDQDIQAFKLVFRLDGAPQLSKPVTPPRSSVTRSHFVALEARA